MKFNIKDIAPEGLRVGQILVEAEVRRMLSAAEVETTIGDASATLELELSRAHTDDKVVVVRGTAHASFHVPCGRCLRPALVEVDEPALRLTFLPPAQKPAELELTVDDLDTYAHDGEEVDLEPVLRELLLLGVPLAPLCAPGCRGFCLCGADLDVEACRCPAPVVAPIEEPETPWAAALGRLKKSL